MVGHVVFSVWLNFERLMLQLEDDEHLDMCMLSAAAASPLSPPSYSEAIRSPGHQDEPSIWTTPISAPSPAARSQLRLDVDRSTAQFGAVASPSPSGLNESLGFGRLSDSMSSDGFGVHRSVASDISMNTPRKKEYRNWNPPMLGNLPDDFLRLIPRDTARAVKPDDKMANLTSTPINVMSMTDARPKIHKSRSKSDKSSRSFSFTTKDAKEKDSKSRSVEKKSKSSDKITRSLSLVEEGHKSSAKHKDHGLSPRQHSVVGLLILLSFLKRQLDFEQTFCHITLHLPSL